MMGRSHRVSGIAAGLGYADYLNVPLIILPIVVTLTAVGSLVPDIDCHGSTASKSLYGFTEVLSWITRRVSHFVYVTTKGRRDEDWEGTHRHLTHTVAFAVLIGSALWAGITPWFGSHWGFIMGGALAIGCFVHDLGDSLTLMGCPFLWPLPIAGETFYEIRPPRLLRFRTGGPFERWIMFPALTLTAVLLVPGVWPLMMSLLFGVVR